MATEKKMTVKGFLRKLNSKAAASALGFFAAHREYLLTGELAEVTRPIVEQLDKGTLFPTPAIAELRAVVTAHIIALEAAKAEGAIERANKQGGTTKPFEAMILNSGGHIMTYVNTQGETKELRQGFKLPQEAQRWVDRRLFDGAPHWHGEVLHNGSPWEEIDRGESIARILRQPAPTVTKKPPSSGKMGWGVKVRESKGTFSSG